MLADANGFLRSAADCDLDVPRLTFEDVLWGRHWVYILHHFEGLLCLPSPQVVDGHVQARLWAHVHQRGQHLQQAGCTVEMGSVAEHN